MTDDVAKPRTLFLEVGFRSDLLPCPGLGSGKRLLAQGFRLESTAKDTEVGNPVALARCLNKTDEVKVILFDLTRDQEILDDPIISMSFRITFSPQVFQPARSPIGVEVVDHFRIYSGPGRIKSEVFGEIGEPFTVERQGRSSDNNQLEIDKKMPVIGSTVFSLANSGTFYYSMDVKVIRRSGLEPERFRIDPEMIVTTDGSPDED